MSLFIGQVLESFLTAARLEGEIHTGQVASLTRGTHHSPTPREVQSTAPSQVTVLFYLKPQLTADKKKKNLPPSAGETNGVARLTSCHTYKHKCGRSSTGAVFPGLAFGCKPAAYREVNLP